MRWRERDVFAPLVYILTDKYMVNFHSMIKEMIKSFTTLTPFTFIGCHFGTIMKTQFPSQWVKLY